MLVAVETEVTEMDMWEIDGIPMNSNKAAEYLAKERKSLRERVDDIKAQLAQVTAERDEAQGLLLATSAALDVMRETAEIAARPAALIIKALAKCEGEKYALTAQVTTWHTPDEKPEALEPVQAWYGSGPCGYAFHRIVQWTGIEWIALYDHKPCSIPDRWAYLPKFETEVTA